MIPLKELLDRPYYATTASFSQAPLRWFSLAMSGGIPGRLRSRSLTRALVQSRPGLGEAIRWCASRGGAQKENAVGMITPPPVSSLLS